MDPNNEGALTSSLGAQTSNREMTGENKANPLVQDVVFQSGNEIEKTEQTPTSQPDREHRYPTGIRLVIVMSTLMLGTFLMALDSTIVSVANPRISTEFKALDDVGWYGAAYGMTLCAFTPILSSFYNHFNPKLVYLAVIVLFEGTS